jgi:hypothetical protein
MLQFSLWNCISTSTCSWQNYLFILYNFNTNYMIRKLGKTAHCLRHLFSVLKTGSWHGVKSVRHALCKLSSELLSKITFHLCTHRTQGNPSPVRPVAQRAWPIGVTEYRRQAHWRRRQLWSSVRSQSIVQATGPRLLVAESWDRAQVTPEGGGVSVAGQWSISFPLSISPYRGAIFTRLSSGIWTTVRSATQFHRDMSHPIATITKSYSNADIYHLFLNHPLPHTHRQLNRLLHLTRATITTRKQPTLTTKTEKPHGPDCNLTGIHQNAQDVTWYIKITFGLILFTLPVPKQKLAMLTTINKNVLCHQCRDA